MCNCKCARFCNITDLKCATPKTLSLHHPLHLRWKCKILHFCTCAIFCILAHENLQGSISNFFTQPTCNTQSARPCTMAHMQDFAFLQLKYARIKALFLINSFLQGTKCKILHMCKIMYSYTSNMCNYQDFQFFITLYMQGPKSKILLMCTCPSF